MGDGDKRKEDTNRRVDCCRQLSAGACDACDEVLRTWEMGAISSRKLGGKGGVRESSAEAKTVLRRVRGYWNGGGWAQFGGRIRCGRRD